MALLLQGGTTGAAVFITAASGTNEKRVGSENCGGPKGVVSEDTEPIGRNRVSSLRVTTRQTRS